MERWTPKLKQEQCLPGFTLRMWTDKDGEYVLYTDHIAETRKLIDTYDLLISQEDKKIAELEAENKRLREALKEAVKQIGSMRTDLQSKNGFYENYNSQS